MIAPRPYDNVQIRLRVMVALVGGVSESITILLPPPYLLSTCYRKQRQENDYIAVLQPYPYWFGCTSLSSWGVQSFTPGSEGLIRPHNSTDTKADSQNPIGSANPYVAVSSGSAAACRSFQSCVPLLVCYIGSVLYRRGFGHRRFPMSVTNSPGSYRHFVFPFRTYYCVQICRVQFSAAPF